MSVTSSVRLSFNVPTRWVKRHRFTSPSNNNIYSSHFTLIATSQITYANPVLTPIFWTALLRLSLIFWGKSLLYSNCWQLFLLEGLCTKDLHSSRFLQASYNIAEHLAGLSIWLFTSDFTLESVSILMSTNYTKSLNYYLFVQVWGIRSKFSSNSTCYYHLPLYHSFPAFVASQFNKERYCSHIKVQYVYIFNTCKITTFLMQDRNQNQWCKTNIGCATLAWPCLALQCYKSCSYRTEEKKRCGNHEIRV